MSRKNRESGEMDMEGRRVRHEKLSKDDKRYLNSGKRVAKKFIFGILELVIIAILMMLLACYMKSGNLDNVMDKLQGALDWFQPGGMLFNAVIGYLPILILGCVGVYFGEGTYGRMAVGIVRCFAVILWLVLVFEGASTSMELVDSLSAYGLEDMHINSNGIVKFVVLVMLCSILIPIGEFAGARKNHKRALAKKEQIQEDSE